MSKKKQIKRLFAGMVAKILGFEKTRQMLKEATEAIDLTYGQNSEADFKIYDVYLEIFGKKMKTQILAESEEQAKVIYKKNEPQRNNSYTGIQSNSRKDKNQKRRLSFPDR